MNNHCAATDYSFADISWFCSAMLRLCTFQDTLPLARSRSIPTHYRCSHWSGMCSVHRLKLLLELWIHLRQFLQWRRSCRNGREQTGRLSSARRVCSSSDINQYNSKLCNSKAHFSKSTAETFTLMVKLLLNCWNFYPYNWTISIWLQQKCLQSP